LLDIIFSDAASAEYDHALNWYRAKNERTADRFNAAVRKAIAHIQRLPDSGLPVGRGRRFMATSRYPYYLVYRVLSDRIVIAAVAHNRQSPGRWRRR
jgi:plasmid stabilization system protein ParE